MRIAHVVLLALLTGCQPAGRMTGSAKLGPVRDSPYYPLQVGSTWVFRGPDHQRTMRVARHEQVDGVPCAVVETLRDDEVIEVNHLNARADGVYCLVADGQKLSAPLPVLRLPPEK